MQIPSELQHALQQVSETLREAGECWLIGGSCGLLLQHVQLDAMPRDIDIYADRIYVAKLHDLLLEYAVDEPVISETEQYYSELSHYNVNGYTLELVGGFKVSSQDSRYEVMVEKLLLSHSTAVSLNQAVLPLMPLMHELVFNVLRERSDRYEAIAKAIRKNPSAHLPLWKQISDRCSLSVKHIRQIESLLG